MDEKEVWRRKAHKVRLLADRLWDVRTQVSLHELADQYEAKASAAEATHPSEDQTPPTPDEMP